MEQSPRSKSAIETLPDALIATIKETPWARLDVRPDDDGGWPRGAAYRVRYSLPELGIETYSEYFAKDFLPRGIHRGRFLNLDTTPTRTVDWLMKEIHRFPYGFYFQGLPECWEVFGSGFKTRMKLIVSEWARENGELNAKRAEIARAIAEYVRKKTASQG